MSWYDAAQYCRWLSEREGVSEKQRCYPSVETIERSKTGVVLKLKKGYLAKTGYRLPTEAEWEYACRAGAVSSRSFGWSDELLDRYAWYAPNAERWTWPVGQKKPNEYGLFDMHGNVIQWCHNAYAPYPPVKPDDSVDDKEDPVDVTFSLSRIQRGGSYASPARGVRSAVRMSMIPGGHNGMTGFRVARSIP